MSTMEFNDVTSSSSTVTGNTSGIIYDNHLSWGSESIGIDDYIDYLGDISDLPEIVVGIIDTGIDIDHDFLKNRIVATGSYAEQWVNENGHTFIPSDELSFDSIVGNDFVYSTQDGKACFMPIDIVEQIWYDYMPINKQPNFMTHGYLIDVVNDNFINGKDFAKIHHTAKYSW